MMRLIRLTHEHGNMRARMRYLREFVTTSQGRLTLDAYIGLVRSRLGLVVAAYEDPQHLGYIRTDMLFRAIFMIGLDQTMYERPIQKFNEEHPDASAVEAMVVMQNFHRDVVLQNPLTAAGHVPRSMIGNASLEALVADIPGGRPRKGQFGVWTKELWAAYCEWCFNNGYKHTNHTNFYLFIKNQ